MTNETRTHYTYGASSAHRWMTCHASVKRARLVPERPPSPFAEDGTEAHSVLEYAMQNGIEDAALAFTLSGISWTYRRDTYEDRIDALNVVLEYIYDILKAYKGYCTLHTERQMKFPSLVTDDAGGTVDICIIIPILKMVYVIDFKYGAGHYVAVRHNKQVLDYLCCVRANIPDAHDAETFIAVVAQPRAVSGGKMIREWVAGRSDLNEFMIRHDEAVANCESDSAKFVPGDEACRWCPADLACPAREALALSVANKMFTKVQHIDPPSIPNPYTLSDVDLSYVLQHKSVLTKFIEDCEEEARKRAIEGRHIFGFKVVEALKRREWDGATVTLAHKLMTLLETNDIDLVAPRKLINITAADKLVKDFFKKKGLKGDPLKEALQMTFATMTVKEGSGNYVLAPVTDSRPEVNRTAQMFAQVNTTNM